MLTAIENLQLKINYKARASDLLFLINSLPEICSDSIKYGLYGALIGLGTAYAYPAGLSLFAEQHHSAVDITDSYARESEEFLGMSRTSYFNQVTPSVAKLLPVYSMLVGASAGIVYGLKCKVSEFSEKLHADQAERETKKSKV